MAKMTLFTTPADPLCEMARWSVELLNKPMSEERYPPFFIGPALKRIGGSKVSPFLVLDNGRTVEGLPDILEQVNSQASEENKLYPNDKENGPLVRDFCLRCERDFAPQVVRFFYYHLSKDQFFIMNTKGAQHADIQKFRYLSSILRSYMNFRQKINKDSYRDSLRKIHKFWDSIDALLSDGRKYLFCNRLTAADITFCCFANNLIMTPEYSGGSILYDECPKEIKAEVERLRTSKPGIYVQAVFKYFRKHKFS